METIGKSASVLLLGWCHAVGEIFVCGECGMAHCVPVQSTWMNTKHWISQMWPLRRETLMSSILMIEHCERTNQHAGFLNFRRSVKRM